MTENLAGRGEGLAGLVKLWDSRGQLYESKAYESMQDTLPTPGTVALTCARELEIEIAALEAAAPAGTAPTISMQHPVGEPFIMLGRATDLLDRAKEAMECDPQRDEVGSDCWIWCHQVDLWLTEAAALATPSPQAPQQESSFSTTSAREQSSATASDSLNVAAQEILKPHWPSVRNMEENEARQKEVERIAGILQRREEVRTRTPDWQERPAATQEQPAGSAPSIASTSVTTPRKITWFCRICERDHTAYCPAVSEDNFLHLCDHCGQSFHGNQHECPAPAATQEPAGSGASLAEKWERCLGVCIANGWNATATALREDGPCADIDYDKLAGSPRKVGEDGARCNAPNPDGSYLCNKEAGHSGYHVHSFINPDGESDFYMWLSRPSSVPVGEQKQEEGV